MTTLWMIWTWIWQFWGKFLNATLRAAVHLGQDYEANLRYVKNHLWNSVGLFFHETGKLISEQEEITRVSTFGFKDATWISTSSLCEKTFQITNAKLTSSPTLCSVREKWEMILLRPGRENFQSYSENHHFKNMNRIDGMPTEFEWKLFPGITTLGLLEKIQSLMTDSQCEPGNFEDIFMSMYNDVNTIHRQLRMMLANSLAVIGLSWGLDQKRSGTEPTLINETDPGIEWQKKWCWLSLDPVIQYFVPPVPLREENYEAKEEARSQFTSMVVMKTSSCFSAQWFLRISSVSTEQ